MTSRAFLRAGPRFRLTGRRGIVWASSAALLAGAIVWSGADTRPADATQPLSVEGNLPKPIAGATFRVGTFNIHGGRGLEGGVNLDATAAVVRAIDLDLAGLYEVRGDFLSDQAQELGARLEMASVFAPTERRWWHDHFGNALITRRTLGPTTRIPLPGTQGKGFRNVVVSSFAAGGVSVRVLAAHLDTRTDRERQIALVLDLFRSLEAPAILMGDLNCTAEHPPLAALLAEAGVVDAVAEALGKDSALGRIDHLIVRGLEVRDAGVVASSASDHPCVWAELCLPGPPLSSEERTASKASRDTHPTSARIR